MDSLKPRIFLTALGFVFATAILMGQAARWQLFRGPELAAACVAQRRVDIAGAPDRGRFLDRFGRDLCAPGEEWAVVAVPSAVPAGGSGSVGPLPASAPGRIPGAADTVEAALERVSEALNLNKEILRARLRSAQPVGAVAWDVGPGAAAEINKLSLPWIEAVKIPTRYGPNSLARHVVGYIRADGVGMDGYERALEGWLAGVERFAGPRGAGLTGVPGIDRECARVFAFIDGMRRVIPGLGYRADAAFPRREDDKAPAESRFTSGKLDVVLTIDGRVQRAVEEAMDRAVARGAVVVVDVATGDVLAMASRPNFDQRNVQRYLSDPYGALVNRAIAGFVPGSVFKVAVAATALERGIVSERDVYLCRGLTKAGGRTMKCYAEDRGGHGALDFVSALAESCNVVFAEVGIATGAKPILEYAVKLGLGATTGIGLPGESPGLLPGWAGLSPGDVANLSIGQGKLLATPLQVAQMISCVASGGVLRPVGLLLELRDGEGRTVHRFPRRSPARVISQETAEVIRQGLRMAVEAGTATEAQPAGCEGVAGKTGTAETGRRTPQGKPIAHAWFAGYWPSDRPKVAVCVFVEEGMSGSLAAAPVFRDIIQRIAPIYR